MSKQEVVLLWTGQYEGFGMSEQEYEEHVLQEIEKAKNTINLVNSGQIHSTLEQLAKTSKYYTEKDIKIICADSEDNAKLLRRRARRVSRKSTSLKASGIIVSLQDPFFRLNANSLN